MRCNIETYPKRLALAVLLGTVLSLPVYASDVWKLDTARSKFGPGTNTLVLQRYNGKPGSNASGNGAETKFLVISNGKIFMASGAGQDMFSLNGLKVSYDQLKNMRIVEVGENVRNTDHCGFNCQAGLKENYLTLTFTPRSGVDTAEMMSNGIVLNTR